MENVSSPSQPEHPRPKRRRFLGWFLLSVVLIGILLVYFYLPSADPRCITILAHPDSDVAIPLPANCMLTTDAPPEQVVKYLENARKLVIAAKKRADIVIVSFHGGAEGTDQQHVPNHTEIFAGEARGNLPAFAHTVIDAGASLVLGHGPHVMRGLEMYKDHLICYSLGNFATYGMFSLKAETAISWSPA